MIDGLSFQLVGVFGDEILKGNPAAVFLDEGSLSDAAVRVLANSVGATGCAFVGSATRPGCIARVRSYIGDESVPFLTHTIVGSMHALVVSGKLAPPHGEWLAVEVPGGDLPLRLDARTDSTTTWSVRLAAEPSEKLVPDLRALMKATQLFHPDFDLLRPIERAGAFLLVPMASRESMVRMTPDDRALQAYAKARNVRAVAFFCIESKNPARVVARVVAPTFGISEDAVTGAIHGVLAPYLVANDIVEATDGPASYDVLQGDRFGRFGELRVHFRNSKGRVTDIEICGTCRTWIDSVRRS